MKVFVDLQKHTCMHILCAWTTSTLAECWSSLAVCIARVSLFAVQRQSWHKKEGIAVRSGQRQQVNDCRSVLNSCRVFVCAPIEHAVHASPSLRQRCTRWWCQEEPKVVRRCHGKKGTWLCGLDWLCLTDGTFGGGRRHAQLH